uniref:Uncharacterized protein n=1 Tax=Nelumbo nucifera TaxID=4432 RepID=A0A822ZYV6_NELNU|nr:TPA_asm: hypothetical protein HUJ06_017953 [Nelumbo nucifera]
MTLTPTKNNSTNNDNYLEPLMAGLQWNRRFNLTARPCHSWRVVQTPRFSKMASNPNPTYDHLGVGISIGSLDLAIIDATNKCNRQNPIVIQNGQTSRRYAPKEIS